MIKWNAYAGLPEVWMTPVISRKLLAFQDGENGFTLNLMQGKAGATAPPHSHPHRQVVYILSGRGDFQCGDEIREMKAGDVLEIDPQVPHTFASLAEDTQWLEFFVPFREDYRP